MIDLLRYREMSPAGRNIGDARHVWEGNDAAVVETDALFARALERRACHRVEYVAGPRSWASWPRARVRQAGFPTHLTQRVFHVLLADFDFQHLAAVRQGEPKYSVVLRRTARPERQCPVIVPHATKPVGQHHPSPAHRGDMAAVLHIAADVGEVHQQCSYPMLEGFFTIA